MSSLYLYEIAQTLTLGHENLPFERLREELTKITREEKLDNEAREQADLDLQITLRKRFPEKFKDESEETE